MKKVVKFFIDNPKLAMVSSFFMLWLGVMGFKNMKAETFPNVDFATAIITTVYPGASTEVIETKITKEIEDNIRGVRMIKDVKSVSQPGLSQIVVRLDMDAPGIDIPKIMSDLQRAVDSVDDLPQDLLDRPVFLEIKSEEIPVLSIAVTGGKDFDDRAKRADELKDYLEENKSAKNVILEGYSDREFQVILDLEKLQKNYIGVDLVLQKILTRNLNIPSGVLKGEDSEYLTRISATIKSVSDLEDLIVRSTFSGGVLKIKDVGRVKDTHAERTLMTGYNGEDAVILSVNKKGDADTRDLVKDLRERVSNFEKLNPGMEFKFYFDESKTIDTRLSILRNNALTGLLIILITLYFFLPGKTALLTSMALPLSMFATIGTIFFMGMTFNTMTILALVIALGMLLDDNVVLAENFIRLRQHGASRIEASLKSVEKLFLPITVTALTTIAAFLPMLVTKGLMGNFIRWIPITVSLALVLSLLECFLFLPVRLAYYSEKDLKEKHKEDWFVKYEKRFERFVSWLIDCRKKVLLAFFVLIFGALFLLFGVNKFILFPSNQTEIYIARYETKEGTPLKKTQEAGISLTNKIQKEFEKEMEYLVVKAGRTDDYISNPYYKEGNNCGSIFMYVNEFGRNNLVHTDALKRLHKLKADGIDKIMFEAAVNGPPVGTAIDVKFRSNDLDQLNAAILDVKNELVKKDGVFDVSIDDVFSINEIFIHLDYEAVNRLGLTVDQVSQVIRTAVAGTTISDVTIDNKKIDLFVRFEEEARNSIDDLKNIKIVNKFGYLVPLENVAKFENLPASPYVKRFDFKRTKSLVGQIDGESITSQEANNWISKYFNSVSEKYPAVSIGFLGEAESSKESISSLMSAFNISVFVIFGLLIFLFKSYLKPFLILTAIPLGFVGISIGFLLQGIPLSFMSLIGVVGLSGIIINSGIVLISTILDLEKEGDMDIKDILPYAASIRLRSVLITAFTTIAGLIPTAYGIGGFDSTISPMAMAIIWGLFGGTILTLMWIPCGYALLDDLDIYTKKKFAQLKKFLTGLGKKS